jgi:hypothetical protein
VIFFIDLAHTTNNEQNDDHFNNTKWVADNDYNVFENNQDKKWIEKLDGEPTFEFDQVRVNNPNSVLLFDPNREVFVELNENDSRYGHGEDTLRDLYIGRWSNNDEDNLADDNNNNSNQKNKNTELENDDHFDENKNASNFSSKNNIFLSLYFF